jgi:hypothetical protein
MGIRMLRELAIQTSLAESHSGSFALIVVIVRCCCA